MVTPVETTIIAAVSLSGALAQAAVALRWYEPPERDGETPTPYLEAAVFFVSFGIGFAVVGAAVSAVSGLAPPYGAVATLLLTPAGLAVAYATYVGRISTDDEATRFAGAVFGAVLAVYPVAFLAT